MDKNGNDKEGLLHVSNRLILNTIMDNSHDTIYFKDVESRFIFNSRAHASQIGESNLKNMLGKSDFDYFPEEFARQAYAEEQEIMRTGQAKINVVEKWVQDDMTTLWLSASKYPLYNDGGQVIGTWGTSRDITLLKNTEEQLELLNKKLQAVNENLESLSIRDGLSGLFNHRHFYDSLAIALSKEDRYADRESPSGFSIVLFDIDNFKHINDTYGHLIGDYVIKQIGEYLNQYTRLIDTSYRYGGDEFVLIKHGSDHKEAISFAEKIRLMIENMPIISKNINLNITISLGVVTSDEAKSVNELMEIADQRMYESKVAGRNRVT